MIDIKAVTYRVVAVTPDGEQLDITPATTNLGWEEGEKELSARISLKMYNAQYKGKYLSELVQPGTPLFIYATIAGEQKEMVRGTVSGWSPTFTNGKTSVDMMAYDEMLPLRRNEDYFFFQEGMDTQTIIGQILNKWGVPFEFIGTPPAVTHGKMVFKPQYLCDILQKLFDDVKDKGGGIYFMRAKEGKVQILQRGSNEDIYHFDEMTSAVQAKDSYDGGSIVTRVIILGKGEDEGHQVVEATIDGKTEFGVRQVIVEREKSKTLEEATKAANQILKEKGGIQRKTSFQAPDLPFLRKGDRVRLQAGTVTGYFFVKSIRHNAEDQKMSFDVDEDKEKNAEDGNATDGNETSESTEDAAP